MDILTQDLNENTETQTKSLAIFILLEKQSETRTDRNLWEFISIYFINWLRTMFHDFL